MPNEIFRNKVRRNVDYAIHEASDAVEANHPGLEGRIREIALTRLFQPLLTADLNIGTGKIVDSWGHQSQQSDLVIYSKSVLPSVMYNEIEGMFPVETCAYSIEVKTKTSANEISDAIQKARSLLSLEYLPGIHGIDDKPVVHKVKRVVPAVFAFSSDLRNGGKTEVERYHELDPNSMKTPSILALCIVGKGYWYWRDFNKQWDFLQATPEHDEVIDFLSGVINTIPLVIASREHPRLGYYLMLQR